MPSRSFYFPPDFSGHLIQLSHFRDRTIQNDSTAISQSSYAPLDDTSSLAFLIGISPKLVRWIEKNKEKNYRIFAIPRQGKPPRLICAPRTYLKVVQWWILDNILRFHQHEDYVMGFIRGRGAFQNAIHHHGSTHILNVDIKDFFPSITKDLINQVWSNYRYNPRVVLQLTELTTFRGSLPQGAPTSPALANIVAEQLDKDLIRFASINNLKYTRYADDLTFSSNSRISVQLLEEIKAIVASHRFSLNAPKTRFSGKGQRQEVTGFVVNDTVRLPRQWRNNARAMFHNAQENPYKYIEKADLIRGFIGAILSYEKHEADGGSEQSPLLRSGILALSLVMKASKEPR